MLCVCCCYEKSVEDLAVQCTLHLLYCNNLLYSIYDNTQQRQEGPGRNFTWACKLSSSEPRAVAMYSTCTRSAWHVLILVFNYGRRRSRPFYPASLRPSTTHVRLRSHGAGIQACQGIHLQGSKGQAEGWAAARRCVAGEGEGGREEEGRRLCARLVRRAHVVALLFLILSTHAVKVIAPKKKAAVDLAKQKKKQTASLTRKIETDMAGRAAGGGPLSIMKSVGDEANAAREKERQKKLAKQKATGRA